VNRLALDPKLKGDLPEMPEEGSLLPETYTFQLGATRQQIVDQMMAAQKKLLARVWESRQQGLPLKTPQELVILASIVEKETGVGSERPHVASVFINRLNKAMRLQSDPTIIYGIFGGKGKPAGRPIYKSEINKPTPYNTYVIDALPPTPIANPGKLALEAVANPLPTNDFYFVADGTGGHAFASTLDEHEANVRRWRVIEAKMKAEAVAAEAEETGTESGAPQIRGTTAGNGVDN
jgi:UPF0755 protein